MTYTIEEKVEAYLDGRLSDEETLAFERDLVKKEIASVFRETLLFREMLGSLPSDDPPPGLAEHIEASLGLETITQTKKKRVKRISRFGHAVNGFKWGLRWPGYALEAFANGSQSLKGSLKGIDMIAYTLGPLNEPIRERADAIRLPKKPLWKIVLSKLW